MTPFMNGVSLNFCVGKLLPKELIRRICFIYNGVPILSEEKFIGSPPK